MQLLAAARSYEATATSEAERSNAYKLKGHPALPIVETVESHLNKQNCAYKDIILSAVRRYVAHRRCNNYWHRTCCELF